MLAFLKALAVGAEYLETDVHASADGVAVVSHDPDLSRLAGRRVLVGQLTMNELRHIKLDSGQGFSSLAEVLDAFPDARFNIDIKTADATAPAAEAILAAGATDRVLVTSFSEPRRRATVALLPGVATSASSPTVISALLWAKLGIVPMVRRSLRGINALQVPRRQFGIAVVTPRTVRQFHAAGVEVHVWTVNDPVEMSTLLDFGVDGIITDRADIALPLVQGRTVPSN